MAEAESHLEILQQGTQAWNDWRAKHPSVRPELSEADLSDMDLSQANLAETNLSGADLYGADLCGANLKMAGLAGADAADYAAVYSLAT